MTNLSFAFADDTDGPDVFLKANLSKVDAGQVVKITASLSEPVLRFGADSVSADGGTITSVRKLSKVSYLIYVRANDDAKTVDVQVSASTIQNLNKVYNSYSSNEVIVKVVPPPVVQNPTSDNSNGLSKVLDKIKQTIDTNNAINEAKNAASQQAANSQYVNCYGQMIPANQTCNNPNVYNATNPYVAPYNSYGYPTTGAIPTSQPVYDPITDTYYYQTVYTSPTTPVVPTPVVSTPVVNPYSVPYSQQQMVYDPITDTYYYPSVTPIKPYANPYYGTGYNVGSGISKYFDW